MNIHFYLAILFGLSEIALLISKRSKKAVNKSSPDKRSLLILWVTIPVFLTAGGFASVYNAWEIHYPLNTIAYSVIAAGLLIRWIAIIQLGRMFTVDVAISDVHALKTNGLYRVVRHPSYLGLMLIIIGFALDYNNFLSFFITVIPIFLALNYRISVEEQALTEAFGEQYITYKKSVARLIPFIY
jgi:protein-S-isoprenylcysteine O-methyltransferase Ste14